MMHVNFLKYFAVSFILLLTVTLANSQEKNKGVEKVQDDMKVLQGNWICIKQEVNGQLELNVKKMNKRLNFDKSVMIAEWVGGGGKTRTYKGKFELDSTTEPKKFDFIGKEDPAGANLEWIGIYELTENEFILMIVEKGIRPTEFKKPKGTYIQFKRDKD
jgi:uncharacterized protein (TIGR03067 family)